jgi:hypothetical protein
MLDLVRVTLTMVYFCLSMLHDGRKQQGCIFLTLISSLVAHLDARGLLLVFFFFVLFYTHLQI